MRCESDADCYGELGFTGLKCYAESRWWEANREDQDATRTPAGTSVEGCLCDSRYGWAPGPEGKCSELTTWSWFFVGFNVTWILILLFSICSLLRGLAQWNRKHIRQKPNLFSITISVLLFFTFACIHQGADLIAVVSPKLEDFENVHSTANSVVEYVNSLFLLALVCQALFLVRIWLETVNVFDTVQQQQKNSSYIRRLSQLVRALFVYSFLVVFLFGLVKGNNTLTIFMLMPSVIFIGFLFFKTSGSLIRVLQSSLEIERKVRSTGQTTTIKRYEKAIREIKSTANAAKVNCVMFAIAQLFGIFMSSHGLGLSPGIEYRMVEFSFQAPNLMVVVISLVYTRRLNRGYAEHLRNQNRSRTPNYSGLSTKCNASVAPSSVSAGQLGVSGDDNDH